MPEGPLLPFGLTPFVHPSADISVKIIIMNRVWMVIVLLSMGLSGAVFWLYPLTADISEEKDENTRVVVVARGTLKTQVSETGTLEPIRTIDIKSQFSGEVLQLFVEEGQRVIRDQPLVVIRQEPSQARQVAQLRSLLEQEGINVAEARRNLMRQETLHAKGFIARNVLESAEQDAQRAMVRRELAERELLLALGGNQELFARYVSQDPKASRLEEFRVLSPTEGTIIDITVQPGEIITSGTATVGGGSILMKLADVTKMVAKAKINEVNIARVRAGQLVTVRLDAILGEVFEGRVTGIAPQGVKEENIVTYEVTVEIENKERHLRPMMTANVDIQTDELTDVITIPLETLHAEKGEDVVYLDKEGRRVRQPVRVAFRTESEAVVVKGLEVGDRVILPSFNKMSSRR